MKDLLFDSWHQWKVCFLSGCKKLALGIGRIVSCLLLGLLSVVRWLWRRLVSAVSDYPVAAILTPIAVFSVIWIGTYASMKAKVVTAEMQRDSMSYRLHTFESMYDEDTDSVIIVKSHRNDTLKLASHD